MSNSELVERIVGISAGYDGGNCVVRDLLRCSEYEFEEGEEGLEMEYLASIETYLVNLLVMMNSNIVEYGVVSDVLGCVRERMYGSSGANGCSSVMGSGSIEYEFNVRTLGDVRNGR